MEKTRKSRKIKFPEAIGLLIAYVIILMWGALSAGIPTGISICLCSFIAALYGIIVLHKTWDEIQAGILKVIGIGIPATLILLMVGLFSGSWLSSGTTPILIYWGLKILNPSIYLAVTFLITAIGGYGYRLCLDNYGYIRCRTYVGQMVWAFLHRLRPLHSAAAHIRVTSGALYQMSPTWPLLSQRRIHFACSGV